VRLFAKLATTAAKYVAKEVYAVVEGACEIAKRLPTYRFTLIASVSAPAATSKAAA